MLKIQEKLIYLSLSYHEKESTGNKLTKITNGIEKIINLLGNIFLEVLPVIVQLLITFITLFFVDWRFALSIILFAPLFIIITFKSNKAIHPLRKDRYKNYEKASGKMGEGIININTVKSFAQEEKEVKQYFSIRELIKNIGKKEWYTLLNFWIGRNLVIDLGRVSVLLIGVYSIFNNSITIGTLVFVMTLSERTYFSLYRLSRFYDRVEEGVVAVDRFLILLEEKQDIVNKENAFKAKNIKGDIEFKNVSFSYNDAKEKALKNINLKIKAGETLALVGPSGGGKTTTARMIYRHYDPQLGSVFLDGRDLQDYDLYSFRKLMAIVPQEVDIFNTSVEENIAYAKPTASKKEIIQASKIANAHEFIEKLADKYKTEVGERGVKLSGGQRQRIGIARAILSNPKILIFDEATSNLDSYSERLIQDAMDKITEDRTVIIIAHRLSTIKKADKIVVLENGEIVEQGNHTELSKKDGGLYAKLIKLQKLGEVD